MNARDEWNELHAIEGLLREIQDRLNDLSQCNLRAHEKAINTRKGEYRRLAATAKALRIGVCAIKDYDLSESDENA